VWLLKCTWNFRNFKLEFLFNGKRPSLGPVFAVGEKRDEMISASEASPAVTWDGERAAEPGEMPDSGIMLWLAKRLHVYRLAVVLTVSRSLNVTFLLFGNNTNFFARRSLIPRLQEEKQIFICDRLEKGKLSLQNVDFLYILLWETTVTFLQSDWLITDV